jgi:hypothetical protein
MIGLKMTVNFPVDAKVNFFVSQVKVQEGNFLMSAE